MFEAGLDIKEIQYLAGHSAMDMTLRVYTHYDQQSRKAKTVEKVREALKPYAKILFNCCKFATGHQIR